MDALPSADAGWETLAKGDNLAPVAHTHTPPTTRQWGCPGHCCAVWRRSSRIVTLSELQVEGRHVSCRKGKVAQRVSFGAGYPADVHADIPADVRGQKIRSGPRNLGKTNMSARTSMTRRRGRPWPQGVQKNFGQKNFGLNFRSLSHLHPQTCVKPTSFRHSFWLSFMHACVG